MSIVLIAILIFVVTLGAGLLGLYAHKRLPEEQQNDSARSVVGQVAGLVSLLLALVLGTLIGTSFAFFGGQKTALESLSANIIELDQALAQYGPETKPARDKLKAAVEIGLPGLLGRRRRRSGVSTWRIRSPPSRRQSLSCDLTPTTEAQKQALASANALAGQMEHARILQSLQVASFPVNPGLIAVLAIWAIILFFGMGLFAKSNGLVLSALTFGAVCVAFAIFLILELGLPYTGIFRVSPAALEEAMANIDK